MGRFAPPNGELSHNRVNCPSRGANRPFIANSSLCYCSSLCFLGFKTRFRYVYLDREDEGSSFPLRLNILHCYSFQQEENRVVMWTPVRPCWWGDSLYRMGESSHKGANCPSRGANRPLMANLPLCYCSPLCFCDFKTRFCYVHLNREDEGSSFLWMVSFFLP